MIACKQCGKGVSFSAGNGWQHLEPSDHDATPSSKLAARELDPALAELDRRAGTLMAMTSVRAIDNVQTYMIRRELISQFRDCFSAHYYHVPGVPWQTVRQHDQNRRALCHCAQCTAQCQTCQARNR